MSTGRTGRPRRSPTGADLHRAVVLLEQRDLERLQLAADVQAVLDGRKRSISAEGAARLAPGLAVDVQAWADDLSLPADLRARATALR